MLLIYSTFKCTWIKQDDYFGIERIMSLSMTQVYSEKETKGLQIRLQPCHVCVFLCFLIPAACPMDSLSLSCRRLVKAEIIELISFVVAPLMRSPLLILIYFTGWSWSDYQFADLYLQYSARRLDSWTALTTTTLQETYSWHKQSWQTDKQADRQTDLKTSSLIWVTTDGS